MAPIDARCPRCGAPSVGAGGVCAACLLRAGLDALTTGPVTLGPAMVGPVTIAPGGAADPSAPATWIGPYRIVDTLGEGGMGLVYLAEQEAPIRRRVALKVIRLGMATGDVVARFEAERQALALMDHPGIASVLDAGTTADGRPYFAMEYAPGLPITEYCDRHGLGTRARIALFAGVCAAVQHAHQKGIIHRDLKPGNVLVVEPDGAPVAKVIDFGIAKATERRLTEQTMFTQHGALMGTPEYMSPEQADGSLDIDTRTDIYALGVILYELLARRPPFETARFRETAFTEMIRIIRDVEPPRPSARAATPAVARELAGDLDWITLKALEKDRTRRYASAAELAADLARHLSNEPVIARPATLTYRVNRFVRRNRLAVTAAALVVMALVGGLVASLTMYGRAERERQVADAARREASTRAESEARARSAADAARGEADAQRTVAQTEAQAATTARARADESREIAERQAYIANILAADASLRTGDLQEARRRLDACPPDLRAWEWRYLDRTIDSSDAILAGTGAIQQVAFAPDGRSIHAIHLHDVGTSTRLRLASSRMTDATPRLLSRPLDGVIAVSPDARWAVTSGWTMVSVEADPAEKDVFVARGATPMPRELVKLRDLSANQDVATLDLPDAGRWRGEEPALMRFEKGAATTVAVRAATTPTGSAISRAFEAIGEGKRSSVPLSGAFPYVVEAAFSPDGRRVALWSWSRDIDVWDTEHPRRIGRLTGHKEAIASVAFSRDGRRLVSASYDRTAIVWSLDDARIAARFDGHPGPVLSVAIDPSGDRVASTSADGSVRVWDAATAKAIWARDTPVARTVAFSPDGRLVAAGGDDGIVRMWDAETGLGVSQVRGPHESIAALAFSPDGASIASASGRHVRVRRLSAASMSVAGRHDFPLGAQAVAWTADSLPVSTAMDATVRVWPASPAPARTLRAEERNGGRGITFSFSPSAGRASFFLGGVVATDGRLIAQSVDLTIYVWDPETGVRIRVLAGHESTVTGLAFGRGGRLYSAALDRTVRAWDMGSGRQINARTAGDTLSGLSVTRDGSRVVSIVGSDRIGMWDAETLRPERTITAPGADAVAIGPDGVHFASVEHGELRLRLLSTGAVVPSSMVSGAAGAVAYSPSGTRLAVSTSDGAIRIVDALTLAPLLTIRDDSGVHADAEPADRLLPPGLVKIPPLRQTAIGAGLDRNPPRVVSLAFSPDGSRLATAWDVDATIRVFNASPRTVDQRAHALASMLSAGGALREEVVTRIERERTDDDVKRAAIRIAQEQEDDPAALNTASWNVVKTAGASPDAYRTALARAERAVKLSPDSPGRLNTLALALCRAGRLKDALATIRRAQTLRARTAGDLVIAVLIQLKLGQLAAARSDLAALLAGETGSADTRALIQEAKALSASLPR